MGKREDRSKGLWKIVDRKPNGFYDGLSCIGQNDDGTDCLEVVAAKQMCMRHYQRMRLTGRLDLAPKEAFVCKASDDGPCGTYNAGFGFCSKHFQRFKKHGDPRLGTMKAYRESMIPDPVWCRIVCQGVRCGLPIGRGHGDGLSHSGSSERELCGAHDARWREYGDTRDDVPIAIVRSLDAERPPCVVPGCEKAARGWQGDGVYCSPHRQRLANHGHTDLVNQNNIGLTCSVEWCDKVCESGKDKFSKGMCAECAKRLNTTGTTELSILMQKRRGNYRTCSVEGCDRNEQGESELCPRHYDQDYRRRNPEVQRRSNAATRARRAEKLGRKSDRHTIPELHEYWEGKGIDPKYCAYCDAYNEGWQNSIGDHIVPISKGGTDFMENIAPCCPTCNCSKGPKILYEEWIPPNERSQQNCNKTPVETGQ